MQGFRVKAANLLLQRVKTNPSAVALLPVLFKSRRKVYARYETK